jgi:ribonuclease D
MEYTYIDTPSTLDAAVARLRDRRVLAVDTEAAGYHRYLDRLSLLQISGPETNYLIDPFALADLEPVTALLADPEVEIVFHDADYDLRILDRDLDARVRGLWDTQLAAAFLGVRSLGLGNVVAEYLDVHLAKEFQRADWAERPLPEGMLEYAATDTAYLIPLRDRLEEELRERGRLAWAQEEFRLREDTRWSVDEDRLEAFLRIKGARDLPPRGLAILRELVAWRESVAEERDVASFRVVGNEALLALSAQPPRTVDALRSLRGFSPKLADRRGGDVLAAISRGLAVPEQDLPRFPRHPRPERDLELESRIEALRRARSKRAGELDLDPGFLMPRSLLAEVARAEPRTLEELGAVEGVRAWQTEALGDALLAALHAN